MPRHSSRKSPKSDNAVDLSTIFIGRQQQLDLFEIYLHRWKNLIFDATTDPSLVMAAPSPNTKIQGLMVLLYGRGGFGKSTLLRHYRHMVLQENQNPLVSKVTVSEIIDWEFAVEGKRSLFNPSQGQEVDAQEYYHVLCGQLAIALEKTPSQFREYQSARSEVAKARKEVAQLLGSLRDDDRNAALRDMTVDGLMTALSSVTPSPVSTIIGNDKVQGTARESAKLLSGLLAQLKQKVHDRLGEKFGDFLDPALRLGLASGRDLNMFARDFPLLILYDTYEEIDEGDRLLRIVMGAAGLRVGWVFAGRDNLWAGAGQIERSLALEYGYKEIVPSDRGLAVDFNVGGVGAFTISDIKDYFDLLCNEAHYVPPLPKITVEGAKRILDVTKGVPLAVKIAAGLYLDTADLDTITEQVEGKREIVDQMVRRYLLHARDDQSERAKLYGLALLRRADQPMAVAAALGLTLEQVNTSYARELSFLHRRYSFIFTEKEEPSLHQEVRTFLRMWLLERYDEPEIQALNERLKAAHETSLKRLEDSRKYASLKARFEDDQWVATYVDLTEQQFWLDPVEGLHYALPFMIADDRYRTYALDEVTDDLDEFFEAKISSPYIDWWTETTKILSHSYMAPSHEQDASIYRILEQRIGFPLPLSDNHDEIEALLWWKLGDGSQYENKQNALEWYEKALTRLGQEPSLREATADIYDDIADELYEKKKYTECITLLDKAIELNPESAHFYNSRGIDYDNLKEYQRAIDDYNQAIELDLKYVHAYNNRGIAYYNLEEYQRAIDNYNQAIELDPKLAYAFHNRGNACIELKEYQRAIDDYNQAIELDPKYVDAYFGRGFAYYNLKEHQRAIDDYNQAIELDPKYVDAYFGRGSAYLCLKSTKQAWSDFYQACKLDPKDFNASWMAEWSGMDKERAGLEIAEKLETIAAVDSQHYVAFICRGVVFGLLGKLKEGLVEIEKAVPLEPEEWDAYFWKGMISAYLGRNSAAIEAIEQSLELGLPPVLLTPLYWLERDRPDFFEKYAKRLLDLYHI